MKLKRITLEKFRGFKQFTCEFQQGLNVLVGLNGYGKTSLLDAIAIGYGQFLSAIGTGIDRGIHQNEIHLSKHINPNNSFSMEYQFPVTISCETYPSDSAYFPSHWHRSRNTLKGRTTQVKVLKDVAQQLQKDVQNNIPINLPIFGYYGTGRLWKQKKLSIQKIRSLTHSSRLEGYRDCMDPESSFTAFELWLKEETIADFERKMKIIEESGLTDSVITGSKIKSRLLLAISSTVDTVLEPSEWSNIRYSPSAKCIIATHPKQGDIPVSMLSDGVRNMIGMVADIAFRCVRLNPHLEDKTVKETHGLILVDEVDMHLHPEWQQLVLQNLSTAFPNIQFIVTTHSHLVTTTVKKEQILLLQENNAITPLGNTYGESSDYVLKHLFGVNTRPPLDYSETLNLYLRLIEAGDGKSPEASKLRITLNKMMGESHSDLQAADRTIKRKEFLG